jgi:hypothetical protein
MRKSPGLVVTGMMLVLAFPAVAKDRKMEGGENRIAMRILPGHPVSGPRQTVNLDSRGLIPALDPTAPRLFGSVPMGDNIALGVGLFSVVGTTEKEQVRRRLDPSREYSGSHGTRVAAVGMSLRF